MCSATRLAKWTPCFKIWCKYVQSYGMLVPRKQAYSCQRFQIWVTTSRLLCVNFLHGDSMPYHSHRSPPSHFTGAFAAGTVVEHLNEVRCHFIQPEGAETTELTTDRSLLYIHIYTYAWILHKYLGGSCRIVFYGSQTTNSANLILGMSHFASSQRSGE